MKLDVIEELTDAFNKFDGVGRRSAERMAYQILEMDDDSINKIVNAIDKAKKNISICPICGSYKENNKCFLCDNELREKDKIIVVTSFKDVLAFEKLNTYNGLYHILNGNISPTRGIGPDDINIESLLNRLKDVHEVILATDPTVEGETTALYIAKLLENKNINTSRLAYGLPMGAHLTYADDLTLLRSFEGRKKI